MSVNIVISNRAFLIKDAAAQRVLTGTMGLDFRMRSAASLSLLLFSVGFPSRLAILDGNKAALCWRFVSAHQAHLTFIPSPIPSPLIPAQESLSDGLISCTNATFIIACSILYFQFVGSAVTPWPLWNVFAVNGCPEWEQRWENEQWGLTH